MSQSVTKKQKDSLLRPDRVYQDLSPEAQGTYGTAGIIWLVLCIMLVVGMCSGVLR